MLIKAHELSAQIHMVNGESATPRRNTTKTTPVSL